jgi:glycosyltransferase involved in cell wall biosynthesis
MSDDAPIRVMFLYWGRRGLNPFVAEIASAAARNPGFLVTLSVSQQNEDLSPFDDFGSSLMKVHTFSSTIGSLTCLWRLPGLRKQLANRLRAEGTDVVVTLIPHVWSYAISSVFTAIRVRHFVIAHDGQPHPGDPTGLVHRILMKSVRHADRVVTLSKSVTRQLVDSGTANPEKISTLFLPNLALPTRAVSARSPKSSSGEPWRLLFLGRIQAYKGLPLLVAAVEQLVAQGASVELTVMGEGAIGPDAARLNKLGARVVNRWISDDEIAEALANHDVAVLPYVEASQSGIVAMAHGRGLPVIATPVGGLSEQIQHGVTGFLTSSVTSASLAQSIEHVFTTSGLLMHIRDNIRRLHWERSTDRFVAALRDLIVADSGAG